MKRTFVVFIIYSFMLIAQVSALMVEDIKYPILDIPKNATAEDLYRMGKEFQDTYEFAKEDVLEKAVFYFTKALSLDKSHIKSYIALSDAYVDLAYYRLDRGKEIYDPTLLEYASGLIEQAENINPDLPDLHKSKALLFNALHKFNESEKEIREALSSEPENPVYNTVLARVLYNQFIESHDYNLLKQTIKQYEKVLELNPTENIKVYAYDKLGMIYMSGLDEIKKAIELFEAALQINPDSVLTLYHYSLAFNRVGEYDKAIEAAKKGLKLKDLSMFHENLGNSYLYKGELDNAAEEFFLLKDTERLLIIAQEFYNKKEFDKSMILCQKILQLKPNDPEGILLLGYSYEGRGEFDKALLNYKAYKEMHPDFAHLYFRMGYIYDIQNKYELAIENYNEALKYDPQDFVSLSNLAVVYLKTKQKDLADVCYKKILALKQNDADLLSEIGNDYYSMGQKEEAIKYYEQAARLGIKNLKNYLYLGHIYLEKKEYAKAVPVYEKALAIEKKSPIALNDLAWSYAQLNINLTKAVEMAKEALKLEPLRREVLDTLVVCNTKLGIYYLKKFKVIGSVKAFTAALNYKIKLLKKNSEIPGTRTN